MRLPSRLAWLVVVAPIIGIAMIAAAVHGLMLPLIAFVFARWGHEADVVGLNAAAGTCGILLLWPFLPGIIARFGLWRLVAGAIVTAVSALASMAALPHVVAWFLFKVVLGLSLSVIWTAAELWINLKADDRHRGRAFSLFALSYWIGFASGPGILTLTGVEGALPFIAAIAVMATAFLLLKIMRDDETEHIADRGRPQALRPGLWPALIVLAPAVMGGAGDGAMPALLPTFGLDSGIGETGALALLETYVIGGIVFQWPVGWLADKVSERLLAFICIAAAGLCLLLLPSTVDHGLLRMALSFLAGGFVMSISTLGLVIVGRSFAGGMLAVMSTWFSVFYEVGGTIGPIVASASMVRWGASGLPLTLVAGTIIAGTLFLIAAGRIPARVVSKVE